MKEISILAMAILEREQFKRLCPETIVKLEELIVKDY